MPIDPLDQQLVEAVLSRPRRAKADLEEAKLAGLRPSRAALDDVDEDEEEDDEEPDLAVAGDDLDDDVTIEVVGEDAEARKSQLPAEGPTKLDPETASLAQAVIARREPNPRALSEADLAYEIERLTIDLEERSLDERADYIAAALSEAEQAADRAAIDQYLRESQAMNEQRKSLHRRRDQTHLISSTRR